MDGQPRGSVYRRVGSISARCPRRAIFLEDGTNKQKSRFFYSLVFQSGWWKPNHVLTNSGKLFLWGGIATLVVSGLTTYSIICSLLTVGSPILPVGVSCQRPSFTSCQLQYRGSTSTIAGVPCCILPPVGRGKDTITVDSEEGQTRYNVCYIPVYINSPSWSLSPPNPCV